MQTKLMLQLVSFHKPSLAVANLKRFKETLAPLESRIPASLSLLWVLSQSAVKDTRVGVQGERLQQSFSLYWLLDVKRRCTTVRERENKNKRGQDEMKEMEVFT